MDCKRIRELLATDYIDGRVSDPLRKEIEAHVDGCIGCRAFVQTLREKVSLPLRTMGGVEPPEELWQRIKATLEQEQSPEYAPSFVWRLGDFVRNSFPARRPAFALAALSVIIVIGVTPFLMPLRQERQVKDYLNQQSSFMVSLNKPANGELESELSLGTAIEQFLF